MLASAAQPIWWELPPGAPALKALHRELIARGQLGSPPEITMRLIAMVDGDTSIRDIAALIARDAVLTASILRLANSVMYAVRHRVVSIPEAARQLGLARVREVAIALSLWNRVEAPHTPGRAIRLALWTHASGVAVASRVLAEAAGLPGNDAYEAYTAGLLHDVGVLLLGFHFGASYWALIGSSPDGPVLVGREEEAFGCHHATVGAWLLEHWSLPMSLIAAVGMHHAPGVARAGKGLAPFVAVAETLVEALDAGSTLDDPRIADAVQQVAPAPFTVAQRNELVATIAGERAAISSLFSR